MRGFPLVNTLVVLAFFAVVWWPLRQLTGNHGKSGGDEVGSSLAPESGIDGGDRSELGEKLTARIFSSHPIRSIKIEHLGEVVVDVSEIEDSADEIEYPLGEIEIPKEGIEFWVEAELMEGAVAEDQRSALSVEIISDNLDRDPVRVTVWGNQGDVRIADLAVFEWHSDPGEASDD